MAEVARRHPQLNLLNLEAAASASLLNAEVWLSEQASTGVLPSVLDAERTRWKTVARAGSERLGAGSGTVNLSL